MGLAGWRSLYIVTLPAVGTCDLAIGDIPVCPGDVPVGMGHDRSERPMRGLGTSGLDRNEEQQGNPRAVPNPRSSA